MGDVAVAVRVIQVIEAVGVVGVGTDSNPHRSVTAYFTLEGQLLAEHDPRKDSQGATEVPPAGGAVARGLTGRV